MTKIACVPATEVTDCIQGTKNDRVVIAASSRTQVLRYEERQDGEGTNVSQTAPSGQHAGTSSNRKRKRKDSSDNSNQPEVSVK